MSDQNKTLARRSVEEVWNQRRLAVIDELIAPNATFHDTNVPGGKFTGADGYKKFVETYLAAFPDVHFTINDLIEEGDRVVTRWSATGTHKGALMAIPPTNKRATVTGVDITRYENGKVVEEWLNYDMLGMLHQLGVIPAMAPAGAPA
ncbi:MAG: ester cyclase [Candidatus Dormiibacterota bacterium]